MKKKIITLLALIAISMTAFAPPTPLPPPATDRNDIKQETPVGTATLLLLAMSGAFAGYKVIKRKKERV